MKAAFNQEKVLVGPSPFTAVIFSLNLCILAADNPGLSGLHSTAIQTRLQVYQHYLPLPDLRVHAGPGPQLPPAQPRPLPLPPLPAGGGGLLRSGCRARILHPHVIDLHAEK